MNLWATCILDLGIVLCRSEGEMFFNFFFLLGRRISFDRWEGERLFGFCFVGEGNSFVSLGRGIALCHWEGGDFKW